MAEKFTGANLNYCQEYLDYIKTVNPANLKFFDECGIKLPDVGRPNYGHSLIGTPAVEVMRNMHSPNITLNLLCGLDGVIYANTIDGSSNSITFLKFFEESSSIRFQVESLRIFMATILLWTTLQFTAIEQDKLYVNGLMIWGV